MSVPAAPFTAPKSCSTTWIDGGLAVSVGVQCSSGKVIDDPNCMPPTATACPFNWRPVTTKNAITTCCPSEFDLNLDVAGRCYSTAGGNVLQGITCNPSVAPTSATITYGFKPGVWAVAVSYAGGAGTTSSPVPSSRNPDSAVSSSIAGTITPAPSAPSNTISSTPTNSASTNIKSGHLSGGAIAGIVIGSIFAVALILAAIFFLKKRRKGSAHFNTHAELAAPAQAHYVHEKGAYSPRHSMAHPVELESHDPQRM